tara:strand:+ start:465 stop:1139 length:675 start_codon:yes stop_codon:yes gene_type:complete
MDLASLREKAIVFTKQRIKETIKTDHVIIQLVGELEDLDSVTNKLMKRLKDWSMLHIPEWHEDENEVLVKKLASIPASSMGKPLTKEEHAAFEKVRQQILVLYAHKEEQRKELELLMQKEMPNITCLAGSWIAGRLLRIAGSLEDLSSMPASTIQVLGAEKALFRHMTRGSKPPKYGVLLAHEYVASAEHKGKAARTLADKLAIAAKVDYFKGEFIGDKLKEML